ncbi:hypothetical protein POM88_042363 [Heracleum sosnowskyi]|uniref:Uncharacterized protein n=1 Tax=Heracleum sosnowskyi TaxID=360622 RepID=A0AAD8HG26_9APIA|nr:hypothetical protein POM88_042363 [Heracleum sosnowskyi]
MFSKSTFLGGKECLISELLMIRLSLCKSPAEWTTDNLESNFTPEEHNLGDKHVVIIIIDENPYAILPNVKNDMHQESGLHYNYNQWQLLADRPSLSCTDATWSYFNIDHVPLNAIKELVAASGGKFVAS